MYIKNNVGEYDTYDVTTQLQILRDCYRQTGRSNEPSSVNLIILIGTMRKDVSSVGRCLADANWNGVFASLPQK